MHYNKNRYATDKKVADNITESWLCVDCGVNTAPGIPDGPTTRIEMALKGTAKSRLEHVPPQLNQGDSRGAKDGRVYRH